MTTSPTPNRDLNALTAIAKLGRLEYLKANWAEIPNREQIANMHQSLGPHLRRTNQSFMPLASLQYLVNLEQLELSWLFSHHPYDFCPGAELAPLHQLKRLVLFGSVWNPLLARTVRALSIRHQLRELCLRMAPHSPQYHSVITNERDMCVTLNAILDELAGVQPAASTAATNAATAPAAAAAPAIISLDGDESSSSVASSSSSSSSPAMLETLRVEMASCLNSSVWTDPMPSFALGSALRLPALRVLQIHSVAPSPKFGSRRTKSFPLDLAVLESMVDSGATLPPIESLSLRMDIPADSYMHLTRLTQLRKLRVMDSRNQEFGGFMAHVLPSGCLARWAAHLLRLEVLMIEGLQIPRSYNAAGAGAGAGAGASGVTSESELACLSRMTHLRALSLTHQAPLPSLPDVVVHSLNLDDLTILPRLTQLEELKLERIDGLCLQERNWMDELGRPMPSSSSAAAAAAASSPSAAPASTPPAASLFTVLSQCRSLRLLRWVSTDSVLQESADYTGLCSWDRTRPTVAEQKRRLIKEQARDRQALRKLAQMKKDETSAAAVAAVASSADVATDPSFDLDANAAPVDYLTSADAQQAEFDSAILDEERDIEIDTKARVEAERQAKADKASKKKPKGAAKKK